MKHSRYRYISMAVLVIWAVAIWAFYQYCYEFSFYYKEQNQLFLLSSDYVCGYFSRPAWAALLSGDFITQFFYYMYAGAAIFSALVLLAGFLTCASLRRMRLPLPYSTIIAIVVMTAMAVFNFDPDYRLSSTMSIIGVLLILLIWTLFLRFRLWIKILSAAACLALSWWMFGLGIQGIGKLSKPYFVIEDYLAADNLYYFGRYDELDERVSKMQKPSPVISCYYYMAMAQTGMLPQSLGKVNPVNLGTLYHIGPKSTIQEMKLMNEFYFLLGDMTLTERAAMLGCVSSPDNRNVRMIKRLAEANLVAGDNDAAMKYLRLLDKTLAYSKWSKANRPATINGRLKTKQQYIITTDTIRRNDHCREILLALLRSNPRNRVALDYLLCTDIQVREIVTFHNDYMKYYKPVFGETAIPLYRHVLNEYDKGVAAGMIARNDSTDIQ